MVRSVSIPMEWGYVPRLDDRVERYEATRDKEPTARIRSPKVRRYKRRKEQKPKTYVDPRVPLPITAVSAGVSLDLS